jgi:hypothetical protein
MSGPAAPRYGTPNWEMIGRWLELPPAKDGPFWAVNLMKYKARADYGDAGDQGRSGREADDAYAPLGPLAAIGAMVAFVGDVVDQRGAEPAWDRVGIVRYPNRAAFFAMQQRDDFKDQHVHKEAGMDTTIVLACLPQKGAAVAAAPEGGDVVVRVGTAADAAGATPLARFEVEGVIVGDDRTWDGVRFDHAADDDTLAALLAAADPDGFTLVVAPAPGLDRLAESIDTAGAVPAREA